jgi:DNA repair protein RecN (Recombination protein N)
MVTTNPGQPAGQLKKIASGGELSRISLAIQVITAQQMATPTLILDEVDSGISGKTAASVGALMRELSANAQILCITHLPQVAAQGHHHFKVEKIQNQLETSTQITPLETSLRVQELARLLGGISVTPEAIAHAQKLMETVCE